MDSGHSHGAPVHHDIDEDLIKACRCGHLSKMKRLLAKAGKDALESPALLWAAAGGSTECVQHLLAKGVDPNLNADAGRTPLLSAAEFGREDCVRIMIAAGARIDHADKADGRTALMLAAWRGSAECVEMLLASGADVSLIDKDGQDAWSIAKAMERDAVAAIIEPHAQAIAARAEIAAALPSGRKEQRRASL